MIETFKRHWPEYIYEAIGLALFMTFAGGLTVLLEHPDSPVHAAIPSKMMRHVVLGIIMGTYIGLLIYSPWGRKTGAHINPAVTIAFWRMGKISKADAIFYIIAQFVGALITARLLFFFIGNAFAHPDVKYGATVPGPQGALVAFRGGVRDLVSAAVRDPDRDQFDAAQEARWPLRRHLIALYLMFETPLSGMSLNPARTFGSAMTAQRFDALWVYFFAPTLAMWLAVEVYMRFRSSATWMHRRCRWKRKRNNEPSGRSCFRKFQSCQQKKNARKPKRSKARSCLIREAVRHAAAAG
jgi:aquaporin Z